MAVLARAAIVELGGQRGGAMWRETLARREPIEAGLAGDVALPATEGLVVVGTIDGTVAGYGCSRLAPLAGGGRVATITDLYVDREARGVGVGESMVALLVDHARSQGAVGVDSLALPGDRATKNFFETFGLKARAILVHLPLEQERAGAPS